MSQGIPKNYEPSQVESRWYGRWTAAGCFTADPRRVSAERPAYSIVIPPPNVTGVLHMGHVLNNTIQDILARKARLDGKEVLWLPGTDHAGIATQVMVEKQLKKTEGKTRHDLGREEFLKRVWAWKQEKGGIIVEQLKKLGCSCDWTRERFTMDEHYSRCIQKIFVDLYKKGYIYRGKRMVNWCPASLTALSDEEVIMEPNKGFLYYFKVEVAEEPGTFLTIATTRPETIPGDTAIAVNPKDERYAKYIGKHAIRPLPKENQARIPIVGDESVEFEFGTGVLKVTPAHDKTDFEIGRRHGLEVIDIMNPDGTMNALAGEGLAGTDRFEAREKSVELLKEIGSFVKEEPYENKVGISERAKVPIEPRLSEQWFLKYPSVSEARNCVATETPPSTPQAVPSSLFCEREKRPSMPVASMTKKCQTPIMVSEARNCVASDDTVISKPASQASPLSRGYDVRLHQAKQTPEASEACAQANARKLAKMRFHPMRWDKTYKHWMDNLQDWCISRQLWWGHRIPVWYSKAEPTASASLHTASGPLPAECGREKRPVAGATDERNCVATEATKVHCDVNPPADLENWEQDPDVLDTWFSSWLWPFATMGWDLDTPEDQMPELLKKFYPTTDLVTGPDIIFFWVARMIMAGFEWRGEIPFRNVYFTGIVRDKLGRKMSKTLGNSPDPLDLISRYGADALRFGTMRSAPLGLDVLFDEKNVELGRNFCNKLWNAARFRQMSGAAEPTASAASLHTASGSLLAECEREKRPATASLTEECSGPDVIGDNSSIEAIVSRIEPELCDADDHAILDSLLRLTRGTADTLSNYEFNAYTQALYSFFWNDFCDWYLETTKIRLAGEKTLSHVTAIIDLCLRQFLLCLAPLAPFISEELFHLLGYCGEGEFLQDQKLVGADELTAILEKRGVRIDSAAVADVAQIREFVTQARALKAHLGAGTKRDCHFSLSCKDAGSKALVEREMSKLCALIGAKEIGMATAEQSGSSAITPFGTLSLDTTGLVDVEAERKRLTRELEKLEKAVAVGKAKLENTAFTSKAPAHILEGAKKQLAETLAKRDETARLLAELK